jgi:imidazolonepropionase-like amidohydrolase
MSDHLPRLSQSLNKTTVVYNRASRILCSYQCKVAAARTARMRPIASRCRAACLVLFLVVVLPGAAAAEETALVLNHITVIDATGRPPQPDMALFVEGARIVALAPSSSFHPPKGARMVDATGKYVIPGLWDMHVHMIFGDWVGKDEKIILPLFVANGVTGVRDMGGDLEDLKSWRARIEAGSLLGPRMVLSGPMLDGPVPRFPSSVAVKNAGDATRAVDDLKKSGADFIKFQSLISRESYFAAVDEAKKLGIPFVGHVPDAIRASEASNAGQRSIEHLTGIFEDCSTVEDELMKGPKSTGRFVATFDPARAQTLIALLAKNQTWQVPTLVWEHGGNLLDTRDFAKDPLNKYAPPTWKDRTWPANMKDLLHDMTDPLPVREKFIQMEMDLVKQMHRAGVPFLAGTDTAAGVHVFPGFSLHDELAYLVEAGFTPMEALQTATRNPAEFLGMLYDLGTVEKGKLADLVVLDANPLDDIQNTRKIRAVLLAGRYFSREQLDAMLDGVAEAAAASK